MAPHGTALRLSLRCVGGAPGPPPATGAELRRPLSAAAPGRLRNTRANGEPPHRPESRQQKCRGRTEGRARQRTRRSGGRRQTACGTRTSGRRLQRPRCDRRPFSLEARDGRRPPQLRRTVSRPPRRHLPRRLSERTALHSGSIALPAGFAPFGREPRAATAPRLARHAAASEREPQRHPAERPAAPRPAPSREAETAVRSQPRRDHRRGCGSRCLGRSCCSPRTVSLSPPCRLRRKSTDP